VQHVTALTVRLVLDVIDGDPAGAVSRSEIQEIIIDGVDAFLRAYR
jgi:TetR/AcrR family transcriptional repressor of mexJK operon